MRCAVAPRRGRWPFSPQRHLESTRIGVWEELMSDGKASVPEKAPCPRATKTHLLTIGLEDYFHGSALHSSVAERHWPRLESRVLANTERTLELLAEYEIRATFFILGWVAERIPSVVEQVAGAGHEVACKPYYPKTVGEMSPDTFRAELTRSRDAVEAAAGVAVLGHRIARGSLSLEDLWVLDVLAEEGFVYDSSISPRFRAIVDEPWRRFPHVHASKHGDIWELPISSSGTDGFLLPAGGGNYIRQLPPAVMRLAFEHWHANYESPFNMYFHVWELDPELPRISRAPLLQQIRQYRNLRKMPDLLRYYFQRYEFRSIAALLGLEQDAVAPSAAERETPTVATAALHLAASSASRDDGQRPSSNEQRESVTIVIPCYNEEAILPYLSNTLEEVGTELADRYELKFIFVDDCSTDATWEALRDTFGGEPRCTFIRHKHNQGVSAAIINGIRAAQTEIVCSIDCDCTYDPRQLKDMLPLLTGDVTLVTSSPYHAQGDVLNVPPWRLFLSRTLSRMYGVILRHRIATVTSCFRVYRRSKVVDIQLQHGTFLGLAELLAEIDLAGGKVVEHPAVLEGRLLGYSKMNTLSTILGHIRLFGRMARRRLARPLENSRRWQAQREVPAVSGKH